MGTTIDLPLPLGVTVTLPDDLTLMSRFIIEEQADWFESEISFVRSLIRPGSTVIDIGANYGVYTVTMARLVGPAGSVVSFEPASRPASLLRMSIARQGFVQVDLRQVALSDKPGRLTMRIEANAELGAIGTDGDDVEEVEVTTLDAIVGGIRGQVDFIKLDAEGEEKRILAGASTFFAQHTPLVMFEYKHGPKIDARLCDAFLRRGFMLYRLVPGLGAIHPVVVGEAFDGFQLNLFAVPQSREAELRSRGLLIDLTDNDPQLPEGVRVQEMVDGLASSAWCTVHGFSWPVVTTFAGWEEHRRAVALACHAATRPAAEAFGCLKLALAAERKALAQAVTGARLFTAARLALDLGLRSEAVTRMQPLVEILLGANSVRSSFDEPFLLPFRQHEDLRAADGEEFVRCVGLESAQWISSFSAYFAPDIARNLLRRIASLSVQSDRSRRTISIFDRRDVARKNPLRV